MVMIKTNCNKERSYKKNMKNIDRIDCHLIIKLLYLEYEEKKIYKNILAIMLEIILEIRILHISICQLYSI
jgi:hypothetical protein